MDGVMRTDGTTRVFIYCTHCGQQVDITEALLALHQMTDPLPSNDPQGKVIYPWSVPTMTDPRLVKGL